MEYTELHCHSYYSFLDGTSSPADLAEKGIIDLWKRGCLVERAAFDLF